MEKKRRKRKRKCRHCGKLYAPDPRTRDRQKHCSAPACRQASKTWRQRRWLSKPENREHFCGPENVDRVREWRKAHPDYWRRCPKAVHALQDDCASEGIEIGAVTPGLGAIALQDDCLLQPSFIVGLIAQLTGSALQDDIAGTIRRMHAQGQSILGIGPGMHHEGDGDDRQTSVVSGAGASNA